MGNGDGADRSSLGLSCPVLASCIAGSVGESNGQLPAPGSVGESSAGEASFGGGGRAKFRGGDLAFGSSARMPGFCWVLDFESRDSHCLI